MPALIRAKRPDVLKKAVDTAGVDLSFCAERDFDTANARWWVDVYAKKDPDIERVMGPVVDALIRQQMTETGITP